MSLTVIIAVPILSPTLWSQNILAPLHVGKSVISQNLILQFEGKDDHIPILSHQVVLRQDNGIIGKNFVNSIALNKYSHCCVFLFFISPKFLSSLITVMLSNNWANTFRSREKFAKKKKKKLAFEIKEMQLAYKGSHSNWK